MSPAQFFQFLIMSALWGGSYLFLRIATPEFGVIPLLTVRSFLAFLFIIPFVLIYKKQRELITNWQPLLIVGIIGAAIPYGLTSYATFYATSGYASLMSATTPIFSAIIGYFWLKDAINRLAILGIMIAFIGVYVLALDKESIDEGAGLIPVYAALVAAVFYATFGNFSKLKFAKMDKIVVTAGTQFYAILMTLPLSVFFWPSTLPSTTSWLSVLVLGVACTGWAFFTFYKLIDQIGVNKTISSTYLIPVFGIFWGWLFLDEKITFHILVGIVTILSGVALTTGLIKINNKN